MTIETGVLQRYSAGAETRQADLCCPVDYDRSLLALLPQEIIDKDYGCGDPSRYVKSGDVVLDLGSGSGKICYMAAQLVGETGKVIGVDMNDDMLELARKYQADMAQKLGSDRVQFVKGQIQDLALDLAAMDAHLQANPISKAEDVIHLRAWQEHQRKTAPHSRASQRRSRRVESRQASTHRGLSPRQATESGERRSRGTHAAGRKVLSRSFGFGKCSCRWR